MNLEPNGLGEPKLSKDEYTPGVLLTIRVLLFRDPFLTWAMPVTTCVQHGYLNNVAPS